MSTMKVNASEMIRDLLRKHKALTKNPEKGWIKVIQEEMKKEGKPVHETTIYNIRRKEISKLGKDQEVRRAGPQGKQAQKPQDAPVSVTVAECMEIVKLVNSLSGGEDKSIGLRKLQHAMKIVEVLA